MSGVNIGLDLTGVLNGILGVGTNTTTNASGTSNTAQLTGSQQSLTSTIKDLMTSVQKTNEATASSNTNKGKTSAKQNTDNTSSTSGTSTTTSSQDAIDATQKQIDQANSNVANAPNATVGLIQGILQSAGTAFGATRAQQNQAGGYNSTSLELLKNDAMAKAVADSASSVLSYMTGQQQIASSLTSSLLGASKTTTDASATAGSGASNSTGTSDQVSNTTGSSDQTTQANTNDAKTASNIVSAVTGIIGNQETTQTASTQSAGGISIICTELKDQGKLDKKLWLDGMYEFHNYSELTKKSYYLWATPVTRFLRERPSHLFSKVIGKIFIARAKKQKVARAAVASFTIFLGCFLAILHPVLFWRHCWHRLDLMIARDLNSPLES